jgi:thioesterase domain-containing protein
VAYEVARQLEARGRETRNLVLIDTPMPPVRSVLARRSHVVLTFMNLLGMSGAARPGDLRMLLEAERAEEALVPFLVDLGRQRGLRYAGDELRATIERYAAVAEANFACMSTYEPRPLASPGVEGHYFARRDRRWFFAPEAAVSDELRAQNEQLEACRCAERWGILLPGLTVHATTAADHFAMMEDPDTLAAIANVCRRLYGLRREAAPLQTTEAAQRW